MRTTAVSPDPMAFRPERFWRRGAEAGGRAKDYAERRIRVRKDGEHARESYALQVRRLNEFFVANYPSTSRLCPRHNGSRNAHFC